MQFPMETELLVDLNRTRVLIGGELISGQSLSPLKTSLVISVDGSVLYTRTLHAHITTLHLVLADTKGALGSHRPVPTSETYLPVRTRPIVD